MTDSIRFPGQYFDEETGLHYNRFRTYDPETGRYISADPIGQFGVLDQYGVDLTSASTFALGTANLYWYASANPLNRFDPWGLDEIVVDQGTATYYDNNGNAVAQAPYNSGAPGVTDPTVPNKGPTPPGDYTIEEPPVSVTPQTNPNNHQSFCDKSGNCWFAPYKPQFQTPNNRCPGNPPGRCGMHPDGGAPGTAGCTGLTSPDTSDFRNAISNFNPSPSNPLPVKVKP